MARFINLVGPAWNLINFCLDMSSSKVYIKKGYFFLGFISSFLLIPSLGSVVNTCPLEEAQEFGHSGLGPYIFFKIWNPQKCSSPKSPFLVIKFS